MTEMNNSYLEILSALTSQTQAIKSLEKEIKECQKHQTFQAARLDALENPNLSEAVRNFQILRKSLNA